MIHLLAQNVVVITGQGKQLNALWTRSKRCFMFISIYVCLYKQYAILDNYFARGPFVIIN